MNATAPVYTPRREPLCRFVPVRGLRYHLQVWGDERLVRRDRPPLFLMHGWMDVGASYQFVVDALAAVEGFDRFVVAPDWRGFGRTEAPPVDSYWFPDYVGDLDTLIDQLSPESPIDLVGHSMGGNVVMSYGGLRPARIRRLVNLEGFGMPRMQPPQAPDRLVQWLDELKAPQLLRAYPDLAAVARRLMANDKQLSADKAAWLAPHWARHDAAAPAGQQWVLQADPAHKRVNPMLYHVDEVLETWKRITAPVMWMEGEETAAESWWGHRYSRAEFHEQRLSVIPGVRKAKFSPCGHMLHHDQPEAVARELAAFLA